MPNVAPRQLRVMRWLTTHLEAITGPRAEADDSLPYDLEGKVFRGRKIISEEEIGSEELLSILEAPRALTIETAGNEQTKRNEKNWTLLLQGWTKDDKLHPSDPAYWLKAAVEARLAMIVEKDEVGEAKWPEFYRMGGLISDMTIGQGLVRPPEQNITKYTMFYLPLIIQLVTDVRRPYD